MARTAQSFFHVSPVAYAIGTPLPDYGSRKLVGGATRKKALGEALQIARSIAAAGHRVEVFECNLHDARTAPSSHYLTIAGEGPAVTLWIEHD